MNKVCRFTSVCLVLVVLLAPHYSQGYSCRDFDDEDDEISEPGQRTSHIDISKVSILKALPHDKSIEQEDSFDWTNETTTSMSRAKRDLKFLDGECSIFPDMLNPAQAKLSGAFANPFDKIEWGRSIRTPFDTQLAFLSGIALFAPEGAVQPLTRSISTTKEGIQLAVQFFEIIRASFNQILDVLVEAGVIPAEALEIIQSIQQSKLASKRDFFANASDRAESPRLQVDEVQQQYQIGATKGFIRYGLPVYIWAGLPASSAADIEERLKDYLDDTYDEEYPCGPLNEVFENPIGELLQGPLSSPAASISVFFGKILLGTLGLKDTDLAAIESALDDFVETSSSASNKRDMGVPTFEAFITAMKESIPSSLANIRNFFQQMLGMVETGGTNCLDSHIGKAELDRVLASLSHDLSPCEASKLFNPILTAAFQAAQHALEIPYAQSVLENLDEIRPIAGVTSPASLVATLKNKIPAQIERLNDTLVDLEKAVVNVFQPLNPFESVKDVGLDLHREVRRLNKAVVPMSSNCEATHSHAIRKLANTANDGLQACVRKAAAAADDLADSVRKKVNEVVKEFRKYYEGLGDVSKSGANQYILTGDQLINNFANYVASVPTTVETSGLSIIECGTKVVQLTRAEAASIAAKFADC